MSRTTAILLAALLSAAVSPALAAWERVSSLDVTSGKTQEFNMENFKGNVIGLTARETDVMCDRVTAVFANGDMRPLFRGKLPKNLSVRVDLPPGVVQRVTFDCRAIDGRRATVDLAADSGSRSNARQQRS